MPKFTSDGMLILGPRDDILTNPDTGVSYEIEERIGDGAFGTTYHCTGPFDEPMVMKVLKPTVDTNHLEREWRKEVDFLFSLRHPHVVYVHDAFVVEGKFVIIMENAGTTARHFVRDLVGLSSQDRTKTVIELGRQLLFGLHFVHQQRVVHRDIHIDNVLADWVGDGDANVKIADFGISAQLGGSSHYAHTGIGRQWDIAPELHAEGFTTPESDVYQAALVMYYLLTGAPALSKDDGPPRSAILSGVARERAESLGTDIGNALARMLRRTRKQRLGSPIRAWEVLSGCTGAERKPPSPYDVS